MVREAIGKDGLYGWRQWCRSERLCWKTDCGSISFAHQNIYFFSVEGVNRTRPKAFLPRTQGQKALEHLSPPLTFSSLQTQKKPLAHMLSPLTSLSPRMLIYGGAVFSSKWLLCTWQVEPAAPVTLMISEVMLRPQRLLGRTASGILMRIPARFWPLKRGCSGVRWARNKLKTSASGKSICECSLYSLAEKINQP